MTGSHRRAGRVVGVLESLEGRVLLHAAHVDVTPIDPALPVASDVNDGIDVHGVTDIASYTWTNGEHVAKSFYEQLSPAQQLTVDPHYIEVDTPQIITPVPGTVLGETDSTLNAGIPVLPDFFPTIEGGHYIDQTAQTGRTLLRFGTGVNNMGMGPGILVGGAVDSTGKQIVYQRLYDWNPATNAFTFREDVEAGRFIYHPGHGHVHYEGYARYRLMQRDAGGNVGAVAVRDDGTDVNGEKVGYCLINIRSSFTLPGGGSSNTIASYGGSGQPNTGCGSLQGIHVGHTDVYSSGLEGQWVDVTGVPNGDYFLELTLDADNGMQESDETNNTQYFPVTLNASPPAGGITADRFDIPANGGPNNTAATATNLGEAANLTESGLTMHTAYDDDWFKFTAASSGNYAITATFTSGDVNLFLYDSTLTEVRRSTSSATGSVSTPRTETVMFNFVEGQTYYAKTNVYNERTSSNYQLNFGIKPTVRFATATPADAQESGLVSSQVVVHRNGSDSVPLTVNYTVTGTASNGTDYASLSGVLNFGDFSSEETITITPLADALLEAPETVTITLSGGGAYVPATGSSTSTVVLHDIPPAPIADAYQYQQLGKEMMVQFSLDVSASINPAYALVQNVATGATIPVTAVSYDPATNKAFFRMASVPADGNYRLTVPANRITHALGEPLAQNLSVDFFVLAGDANRDRTVNVTDLGILAANFRRTAPVTFGEGDFNYDGRVDVADLGILSARMRTTLPAPASFSSIARSGFSVTPLFDRPDTDVIRKVRDWNVLGL